MQVNKQFLQSQYTKFAFVCVCIVWCHTLLTNSVTFRCIQWQKKDNDPCDTQQVFTYLQWKNFLISGFIKIMGIPAYW